MSERDDSLAAGWRVDDNGALRRETKRSMLRRCLNWNYRAPCIYEITLTLADRRSKALGEIVVDAWGDEGLPSAAHCEPSELGRAVLALWRRFGEFRPEIKPLYCQLMPDHLHAILWVTREMKRPLGNAIAGFKTGCEKLYRELSLTAQNPRELSLTAGSVPAAKAGGVVSAKAGGEKLFSPGFNDKILFREGQLDNMFDYLRANPLRLAVKRARPDLFRVVGELKVALPGLSPTAVGRFAAIGNRFLLGRALAQVQVSRRDFRYRRVAKPCGGLKIARDAAGEPVIESASVAYEARKAEYLAAAGHGAVLLSPCVSDGERQIAREALKAGLALVTLSNKGFSKLQKPTGRYFDACTAGRLLMLAPAAWPHQPGEKPMTRFDATAMNRLCQWMAGDGAAEINYHGMRPDNVDALAKAAAEVGR